MRKTLDEYPEMLTVEEAAEYLRVSRAMGYELARQYRIAGGADGLPVTQLGRCLRVPRRELARFVIASTAQECPHVAGVVDLVRIARKRDPDLS